jgi:hypothetical protein
MPSKTTLAVVALLNAVLAGCAGTSGVQILDPALRAAYVQPTTWDKPRSPLRFQSGSVATTCADYARLRCAGGVGEDTKDRLAASEYVVCDQLALLRMGRASQRGPQDRGQMLARSLDLRTFPSALRPRVTDQAFRLRDFPDLALTTTEREVVAHSPDFNHGFSVDAVLDVDGDGTEDWLLSHFDEAVTGNYRAYDTLVVLAARQGADLRAVEAGDLLCKRASSGVR